MACLSTTLFISGETTLDIGIQHTPSLDILLAQYQDLYINIVKEVILEEGWLQQSKSTVHQVLTRKRKRDHDQNQDDQDEKT